MIKKKKKNRFIYIFFRDLDLLEISIIVPKNVILYNNCDNLFSLSNVLYLVRKKKAGFLVNPLPLSLTFKNGCEEGAYLHYFSRK